MSYNKLLIYFVSVFITLLSNIFCIAQTPEKNLLKYWYYRDRLVDDFMTCVCYENGGSIPASIRNNGGSPNNLSWGDATINLAYYIGTLALEHYMLSTSGESTLETDRELFYAMNAINRLDMNADLMLNSANPQEQGYTNGFILRDDVGIDGGYLPVSPVLTKDRINSHPSGSYPSVGNSQDVGIISDGINTVYHSQRLTSIFQQWQAHPGSTIGEIIAFYASVFHEYKEMAMDAESQDQIIHLMVGLSLVIKLLPPDLVYQEIGGIKNFDDCCPAQSAFVTEAKHLVDRLVYRIHSDGTNWHWHIKIPNTDNDVPRGADAWFLSWGFKDAQYELTGSPNTNSSNVVSQFLKKGAEIAWESANTLGYAIVSNGEFSKVADLCAIYNRWDPNHSRGCAVGDNDFSYIPLFKKALHPQDALQIFDGQYDASPMNARNYLENLLNDAPCYGPYNYSNGSNDFPSYEWSSSSRLTHPENRGKNDVTTEGFEGDYNGIDYMFYYNLYRYVFRGDLLKPYNKLTRSNVITDYPFFNSYSPSTGFGSHASPTAIESFNTIIASNKIQSDGDVTYRATESISIQPGFEIDNGGDFYAYIDPIECNAPHGNVFNKISNTESNAHNSIATPVINKKKSYEINAGVFPNPVTSSFSLYIDLKQNQYIHAELRDLLGHQMITPVNSLGQKGQNEISFNSIESLANGIYFLCVSTESIQKTIKVIKSN